MEAPEGAAPPPPVDTAEQDLPFNALSWEYFEKLCVRLAKIDGAPIRSRPYGVKGQFQAGIDIYSRLNEGDYVTYQCKRWKEITPGTLANAVDAFLNHEWAKKSQRFVFCTSFSLLETDLAKAIEEQTDRLQQKDILFEVWDAETLSGRLKAHPGLVEDFFGEAWLERFSRPERVRELQQGPVVAAADLGGGGSVLVVTLDWAPTNVQKMLKDLQSEDQTLFLQLTEAIGTPPTEQRLGDLVEKPPPWLKAASSSRWELVARIAEKIGAWVPSSRAWKESASREDRRQVERLCSAAATAGLGGNVKVEAKFLAEAKAIDPSNPRVRLAEVDQDAPGSERLKLIADIVANDDEAQTHLAAHRALAALLVPDLDLARRELAVLEEIAPESLMTGAIAVNLTVQKGRLDVVAGRPLDAASLQDAREKGLRIRDQLLTQKRFAEAGRMLMLAADATALLGERARAADLIRDVDPAELASPQIPEVLASAAAGRALDFRLARELIEHAPPSPEKRLLEAEILEEIGNAEERKAALKTLDEIIEEGGVNAPEAAFIRIAATLGGRPTSWNAKAADYLRASDHTKAAVTGEVMYLTAKRADYPTAEKLLRPHLDQIWAKATWLRMKIAHGSWTPMKEAADNLMLAGPSQSLQLEAGRAYAKSRNFDRAQEVLTNLAHDPGTPFPTRTSAYRLLLIVTLKELDDWERAAVLHREWIELDPGNPDASAMAVRIANRRRHARSRRHG